MNRNKIGVVLIFNSYSGLLLFIKTKTIKTFLHTLNKINVN